MTAAAQRGTALVTGAGRGIGRAIADALADSGFVVADAGLAPGEDGRHRFFPLDVAAIDRHDALVDAVEAELGPITCLVNNAGITSHVRGDVLDLLPDSFDHVMAVNLRGTFFLTQAVARRMAARTARAFRSIVTISSVNAEIVGENRADYCMSKAALAMMSKVFAARLAPLGIAVFEIRPGMTRTAMTAPAAERYDGLIAAGGVPAGRWGEPADVGAAVATLARGDIPYATGIAVDVAGGLQLHRV